MVGKPDSTQRCLEDDPGETTQQPGTFNWSLGRGAQLCPPAAWGLGVGDSGAWFFLLQVAGLPPGLLGFHLHQAPWGPECIRPHRPGQGTYKNHRHPYCVHVMDGKTQALSWTLRPRCGRSVYFRHLPSCQAAQGEHTLPPVAPTSQGPFLPRGLGSTLGPGVAWLCWEQLPETCSRLPLQAVLSGVPSAPASGTRSPRGCGSSSCAAGGSPPRTGPP